MRYRAVAVLGALPAIALAGAALAQSASRPAVHPTPATPANPAETATAQGDVAVTIYSDGNALVQDTRQLALPSGVSRQEFKDVSSNIRPETVRLSAAGTQIIEQNYDYDLLSPRALMEKAVGQTITLVRTNPGTGVETREQARVLASNDGVVLQVGDHIEVLRDDGLPVRVLFSSLPPTLRARPTLSVTLDSRNAGARPVTISYLTGGMSWSADYVALFDEAHSTIDVQGWVTLRNDGNTPFVNADTLLVAGNPGGQQNGGRGLAPDKRAGTETAKRGQLGDYYLYPIAHRTTIAANQQKQVSFLSVSAVPATKGYEYRNSWLGTQSEPQSAASVIGFSSSAKGGLGDALPAGTVRVYMRDAKGQPQFIGENAISHTPMGSTLAIKTGDAFDVKVKPTVTERTRLGNNRWRTLMTYTLTNARAQPVTVDVVQQGLDWGFEDTRITEQSLPSDRRSSDEAVWHVPVPANGSATLTVTFDTRY